MMVSHSSRAGTVAYTHWPSARWWAPWASNAAPGRALCTSSHCALFCTAAMNSSDTPTDTLKLFQRPGVRLAVMNSCTSGWSMRSTPICAPRRPPPPPRSRALHGGAGLIEHVHVAARPRCHGGGGLHLCALGTDAGEVIAHAPATAHGLGRLTQRFVDARKAFVIHALDAVTHGLHKAVDKGGLYVGDCIQGVDDEG